MAKGRDRVNKRENTDEKYVGSQTICHEEDGYKE